MASLVLSFDRAEKTTPSRHRVRHLLILVQALVAVAVRPHKASLARLWDIPLTVAGLACLDAAAFYGNVIAGLAVTGISFMVLEHLIGDDSS